MRKPARPRRSPHPHDHNANSMETSRFYNAKLAFETDIGEADGNLDKQAHDRGGHGHNVKELKIRCISSASRVSCVVTDIPISRSHYC